LSEISTDDRTTALGLFNYARSYRASADHLLAAKLSVPHAHAPLTYLYYHAIELYLKAYLRSRNQTVEDLKKIGHSISKIAARVQSFGLILDDEDKEVLSLMAEADNVIRSRYIQTGAFSRPEEEALGRTCTALEGQVAGAFAQSGIVIIPALTAGVAVSGIDVNSVTEELSELNAKEREIISYLLHRNERMFTTDLDGGYAATLISRGIVRRALQPGQVFDATDVPMEIPRPIWNVIKGLKEQFSYSGDDDDPQPWRVGLYDRI
jgi:hypothetical protein